MYRILRWGAVGLGLLLAALAFPPAAPAAPARPPATTPTATATPAGEPEWAILQWVAATHSDWNCGPLGGSPGHRVLTGCHPFGYFSHPTDGHVDVYADPAAAQAAWEALRLHARQTYPIYLDTPFGPHPGYEAGDTAYPTAYYEFLLLGRKLGARRRQQRRHAVPGRAHHGGRDLRRGACARLPRLADAHSHAA